jgi:hypothetical protein
MPISATDPPSATSVCHPYHSLFVVVGASGVGSAYTMTVRAGADAETDTGTGTGADTGVAADTGTETETGAPMGADTGTDAVAEGGTESSAWAVSARTVATITAGMRARIEVRIEVLLGSSGCCPADEEEYGFPRCAALSRRRQLRKNPGEAARWGRNG